MCDILICSEDAKFGMPEINLGLIPGAGGAARLPIVAGKCKAMEMIMTGKPICASEAKEYRICNRVCKNNEEALEEGLRIAKII